MNFLQRVHSIGYWLFQRLLFQSAPKTSSLARPTGIIYKPDAIGDFILASGLLRHLISMPDKKWILVCSPQVQPLANHYFPDLEVIILQGSNSKGILNGFKKIISLRSLCKFLDVTELLCIKNGLTGMDHVLLKWLNPRESYGFPRSPILPACPSSHLHYPFTHPLSYPTERTSFPLEVCSHSLILGSYTGVNYLPKKVTPYLELPHKNGREKVLLVFPVTRSHLRNYPLEKLASSIRQFSANHPQYRILISGTFSDKSVLKYFQSLISDTVNAEIYLPESFIAASKIIQESSIILSMDSAPAHAAICLNTPGVFILAGGQFDHFAPWGNSDYHIWIYHRLRCYNCNWKCIFSEPKCITEISEMHIYKCLRKLVNLKFA